MVMLPFCTSSLRDSKILLISIFFPSRPVAFNVFLLYMVKPCKSINKSTKFKKEYLFKMYMVKPCMKVHNKEG